MDDFLEQLRSPGRSESAGRFSLDWRRASLVLGRHLLAAPESVLLKLVQAAVAGQASRLRVERTVQGVALEWDGQDPGRAGLEGLLGAVLSPAEPALRDLGMAIASALNLGFTHLEWRTREGTLRATPHQWEILPEASAGDLRLDLGGVSVDLRQVAQACPHPPLELEMPVSPWSYGFPLAELRHEGRRRHLWLPPSEARLRVALEPEEDYPELTLGMTGRDEPARVWIAVRGVGFAREVGSLPRGTVALVSGDHLRTDASGLRPVEDEQLRELLADLGREQQRLLRELARRLPWVPPHQRLAVLSLGSP